MRRNTLKQMLSFLLAIFIMMNFLPLNIQAEDITSYIALGDSITSGYGLADINSSYVSILNNKLGYKLLNKADETGITSEDLLEMLNPQNKNNILDKLTPETALITITIGGNDMMEALYIFLTATYNATYPNSPITTLEMMQRLETGDLNTIIFATGCAADFPSSTQFNNALNKFTQNFKEIINIISEKCPNASIVVATQYHPYEHLERDHSSMALVTTICSAFKIGAEKLNEVISSVEAGAGTKYLAADVYSAFNNQVKNGETLCNAFIEANTMNVNFDFHPNAKGHQVIADCIEQALEAEKTKVITNLKEVQQKIIAALGNSVEQKKVNSIEQANTYVNDVLTDNLPTGVTVVVRIDESSFLVAKEGDIHNLSGTNGKYHVDLTLKSGRYSLDLVAPIEITITSSKAIQVGEAALSDGQYTIDGKTSLNGEPTGTGFAHYKNGVLILNNYNYVGDGKHNSVIYSANDLQINSIGENNIQTENVQYAILIEDAKLQLIGEGVLKIKSKVNTTGQEGIGIHLSGTSANLTLENKELYIESIGSSISSSTNNMPILMNFGKIILSSANSSGVFSSNTLFTPPSDNYWWRISTDSDFVKDGFSYNQDNYLEVITTEPHKHNYIYTADKNIIIENCLLCEHNQTATIIIPNSAAPELKLFYDGNTSFKAVVNYSSGWSNDKPEIVYQKNGITPDNFIDAGTYTASITIADQTASASYTVFPAEGKITNVSDISKVYDGNAVSDPTFNKRGNGEEKLVYKVQWADDASYTSEAPQNAGSYTLLITVASDGNFTEATYTTDFEIKKTVLTVTAKDNQITYGEAPAGSGVIYSGFVNTEDEKVLEGELAYDFDYAIKDIAGNNYTIIPKGLLSNNYAFNYKSGVLTVIKAHPGIELLPTASQLKPGNALAASSFSGGKMLDVDGNSLDGAFEWKDKTEVIDSAGIYIKKVIFTPLDTNYKPLEFDVEVAVCHIAGHDYSSIQKNDSEHWYICTECTAEKPGSREAHYGGTTTCSERAKCSVCGTNYGWTLAHNFEWVTDKEATVSETGLKHEECSCGTRRNENTVIAQIKNSVPPTRDEANIMLWLMLFVISGVGITSTVNLRKRGRTH